MHFSYICHLYYNSDLKDLSNRVSYLSFQLLQPRENQFYLCLFRSKHLTVSFKFFHSVIRFLSFCIFFNSTSCCLRRIITCLMIIFISVRTILLIPSGEIVLPVILSTMWALTCSDLKGSIASMFTGHKDVTSEIWTTRVAQSQTNTEYL